MHPSDLITLLLDYGRNTGLALDDLDDDTLAALEDALHAAAVAVVTERDSRRTYLVGWDDDAAAGLIRVADIPFVS